MFFVECLVFPYILGTVFFGIFASQHAPPGVASLGEWDEDPEVRRLGSVSEVHFQYGLGPQVESPGLSKRSRARGRYSFGDEVRHKSRRRSKKKHCMSWSTFNIS